MREAHGVYRVLAVARCRGAPERRQPHSPPQRPRRPAGLQDLAAPRRQGRCRGGRGLRDTPRPTDRPGARAPNPPAAARRRRCACSDPRCRAGFRLALTRRAVDDFGAALLDEGDELNRLEPGLTDGELALPDANTSTETPTRACPAAGSRLGACLRPPHQLAARAPRSAETLDAGSVNPRESRAG